MRRLKKKKNSSFRKKRKISPRYVRKYKIIKKVGPLAHKLALPSKSSFVYNVFMRLYYNGTNRILVT